MNFPHSFDKLTPRRKIALAFALLWLLMLLLLAISLRTFPPFVWFPIAMFTAFSAAVATVELLRWAIPSAVAWSDKQHFRAVHLVFAVVLIGQIACISLALTR